MMLISSFKITVTPHLWEYHFYSQIRKYTEHKICMGALVSLLFP